MAQAERAQTTDATGEVVTTSKPCTTIYLQVDAGSAVSGDFSVGGVHDLKETADGTGDFFRLAAGESQVIRGGLDDITTFWVKGVSGTVTYSWYVVANGATA